MQTKQVNLTNTPFYTDNTNDMIFREGKLYYANHYKSIDRRHCETTHYLIKVIKVNAKTVKAKIMGIYKTNQDSWKYGNAYESTLYSWADAKEVVLKLYEDNRYAKGYHTAKYSNILFTPLNAYIRGWWEYID